MVSVAEAQLQLDLDAGCEAQEGSRLAGVALAVRARCAADLAGATTSIEEREQLLAAAVVAGG